MTHEIREKAEKLAEQGKTPLYFARNGEMLGLIAVADVIKADSPQAVKELHNMGIHVVMLPVTMSGQPGPSERRQAWMR